MKPYLLGLYEKSMPSELSWVEKLTFAKNAGFDFLEISIDETDEKLNRLNMTQIERFEIIKTMHETGLYIRTMCLSGHRKYPLGSLEEKIRNKSLEIMEKAIDFAWDIGIRIIQIAGYDVFYEESTFETKRFFLENLRNCVQMAAAKGIVLAFETMETEFINTVYKAMQYVRTINSPFLNVYPDSGNITNAAKTYQIDVLEDLRTGIGHISAMHLKETVPGKFREIPYGTGHVDFSKMIKAALDMNVRLFVAEFWYTGDEHWQEDLHNTKLFLEDKFNTSLKI